MDETAQRLARLNGRMPMYDSIKILKSPKGIPLYNVAVLDGRVYLFRKSDGIPFEVTQLKEKPYHNLKGHERLSCVSCHATWMPQCYGCHIQKKEGLQWDWVRSMPTEGRWEEKRGFLRYGPPALGLKAGRVYPMFSHPVIFSPTPGQGNAVAFLVLASFDPHTTQKEPRECVDCHTRPETWGISSVFLGQGFVEPLFDRSYLDRNGPGEWELKRLKRPGECIHCHRGYSDQIYGDFELSYRRFETEASLPCRK
jgi:hypothetical protein